MVVVVVVVVLVVVIVVAVMVEGVVVVVAIVVEVVVAVAIGGSGSGIIINDCASICSYLVNLSISIGGRFRPPIVLLFHVTISFLLIIVIFIG